MKRALLVIMTLISSVVVGQDYPRRDFALEKLADEIFPIQDLNLDYEELYENLAQLLANPLDLNNVTREQLRSLFVITEDDIRAFLEYREQNGPLLSVYELQSVPGWDREDFEKAIPFVMVHDSETSLSVSLLSRVIHEKNNFMAIRYDQPLATKKGYLSTSDSSQRYAGSPDRFYVRYRVSRSNDFSFGFTLEKDPGEAFNWSPAQKQFGFDYFSWHVQLQNKGRIKNLIMGDYQCQFGQGLVLGSAFGFGKNAETITTVRRSNLGFVPYTSLNENMAMSGAAASLSVSRHVFIHGFASKTYLDAHVDDTSDGVSSLTSSGLHRTAAELRNRKQIEEAALGGVLQFKSETFDGGLIYHQSRFNRPIEPSIQPYNQYAFRGYQLQHVSAYFNYSWSHVTCFGEIARTLSKGGAITAGILGSITPKLELSMLYRSFDLDFYSFRSNAFSENTIPQNEQGVYWGWKLNFSKKYSLAGYMDLFRFPWLRYQGYALSDGHEWLLRFNFTPAKKIMLFVQFREESKIRNLPDNNNLYHHDIGIKRNFWINCDYAVSSVLSFKTRVQGSSFALGHQTTQGLALVQDVSCKFNRWSISARFALFDTDDYNNRIYLYERDVWLAFSFPAYEGSGIRNYVMVQYKISANIDLWVRWSGTRYTDRSEIGTAGETIASNTINDTKFQVRIQF